MDSSKPAPQVLTLPRGRGKLYLFNDASFEALWYCAQGACQDKLPLRKPRSKWVVDIGVFYWALHRGPVVRFSAGIPPEVHQMFAQLVHGQRYVTRRATGKEWILSLPAFWWTLDYQKLWDWNEKHFFEQIKLPGQNF